MEFARAVSCGKETGTGQGRISNNIYTKAPGTADYAFRGLFVSVLLCERRRLTAFAADDHAVALCVVANKSTAGVNNYLGGGKDCL